MNSKRIAAILLTLVITIFAVGVVSAQEASPRAPLPSDILLDDSFESLTSYWQVINGDGDKVKCAEGLGHISNCAFMFKSGPNESTKIKQVYKPNPSTTIDSVPQYVALNTHVKPMRAGQQVKFTINIKFKSGAAPLKKSFVYNSTGASENYQGVSLTSDLFNAADVKSIAIIVANKSPAGKIYVDGFYAGAYIASAK